MDKFAVVVFAIVIVSIGFFVGLEIGTSIGAADVRTVKAEAVKLGYGHYVVPEGQTSPEFKWIEPEGE